MHKGNFNETITELCKYFCSKVAADIKLVGSTKKNPTQGSKYKWYAVVEYFLELQVRLLSLKTPERKTFIKVCQDQDQ